MLVTQLVENSINGVASIESLRSNSIQGLSVVTATFGARSDIYRNRQVIAERLTSLTGQLPQEVQDMVATKRLSPGHARALLKVQNEQRQREMAERSLNEGWSVRQMEEFTKPSKVPTVSGEKTLTEPPRVDPNVKAAISELERVLGTRVRVAEKGKNKGQIEIEYYSDEDLDRIYNQIVGE